MAKKPLAGKKAFEAMGRSDQSRGIPYLLGRYARQAWPEWAVRAYCRGRLWQAENLAKRTDSIAAAMRDLQQTLRGPTPNSELSGPRPLAAEGSRSNDVLGDGG